MNSFLGMISTKLPTFNIKDIYSIETFFLIQIGKQVEVLSIVKKENKQTNKKTKQKTNKTQNLNED